MKLNKYLSTALVFTLLGCNSDDINTTNNYIAEPEVVISTEEPNWVGDFELKTASETDFFAVARGIDSLEVYYSNSNAFHFDKEGYLVNNLGHPILRYPVNPDGSSASVSLSTAEPVKVDYEAGSPQATDNVKISTNLPTNGSEFLVSEFDNQNPLTFNNSTSISVFDSLGESHILSLFFIHTSVENNTWAFQLALDGEAVQIAGEQVLDFTPEGLLDINDADLDGFITSGSGLIENQLIALTNGADDLNITLDLTVDVTSFDSNFELSGLDATGFYTDHLKELKIDSDGLITLSYVHRADELIGRVVMAKFSSPYNLESVGNSLWAETENSGEGVVGEAESANFGAFISLVYDF